MTKNEQQTYLNLTTTKKVKINLRNQFIAHIFATESLHNKPFRK